MSNTDNLSEEDINHRYITPAIDKGWTKEHIRMEYFFIPESMQGLKKFLPCCKINWEEFL